MWIDLSGLGIFILEAMFIPFLPGFFIILYLSNLVFSIRSKTDRLYIKSKIKRKLLAFVIAACSAFITPLGLIILNPFIISDRELSSFDSVVSIALVFIGVFFVMNRILSEKSKNDRLNIRYRLPRYAFSFLLACAGGLFTWSMTYAIYLLVLYSRLDYSGFALILFSIYIFTSVFFLIWMLLSLIKNIRFMLPLVRFILSLIAGISIEYLYYSSHYSFYWPANLK